MKLVVDANILFSFFSEKSFTRSFILNHPEIEYFTPAYVFDELEKHEETIKKKADIDDRIYRLIIDEVREYVEVISVESLETYWEKAENSCPDPDDVHYFACALAEDCPLWSNDGKLKEQDTVKVIDTEELVELFEEK